LNAQTYILEKSKITFFSEAPLENIDATNTQAKSIFQKSSGNIAFQVPIKGFNFKKSLMQQHFNESYMESDKYPNATFSGTVSFFKNKRGPQPVDATGKLTIRGITKNISVKGTLEQKDDQIFMNAKFPLRVEDFDIKIPRIVFFNIAEVVDVDVSFIYKERKQ
jgi:polyisoprenoid-binding protein YceI